MRDRCAFIMKEHLLLATLILLMTESKHVRSTEAKCSMTNPCAHHLGQGKDFEEPAQLYSTSPSWSTTLTVDIGSITYDWLTLKRRLYNGDPAGPTINVKRGDHLDLDLVNNLGPEGNHFVGSINKPHHPNSTNIHTHGLHISPRIPQDDVLISVGPKSQFKYKYHINANNAPGTYWYHAHLHGSAAFQVDGGLAGMLIVEDEESEMPAELAAASCPNNCDKDIQLVFQQILKFNGMTGYGALQDTIPDYEGFRNDKYKVPGGQTLTEWLEENVNYLTTNGQLQPTLALRTGQMHRFRMLNAGGSIYMEMYITDALGYPTSNCDIREIALDGVYLPTPRDLVDGQSLLVPGSRVDWLVKCNTPGTYKLRSFHEGVNSRSIGITSHYDGDLAALEVTGKDAESSFPSTLPGVEVTHLSDLRNVAEEDIHGRFVVEFGPWFYLNREKWSGQNNARYKMRLGETQEWVILNTDSMLTHPFHIHVNHFQVISYNKYTGAVAQTGSDNWAYHDVNDLNITCFYQGKEVGLSGGKEEEGVPSMVRREVSHYLGHDKRFAEDAGGTLGYSRLGDWRDMLNIPPLSNITIRFTPTDYTGNVIVHCHKLHHEDAGMMMLVKVVNPGESLVANIKSGDAYPGTCRRCDRYPPNNATNLCGVTDE